MAVFFLSTNGDCAVEVDRRVCASDRPSSMSIQPEDLVGTKESIRLSSEGYLFKAIALSYASHQRIAKHSQSPQILARRRVKLRAF
jgi:hypothetical protein